MLVSLSSFWQKYNACYQYIVYILFINPVFDKII